MDLLNKFNTVEVNNISRIDTTLATTLLGSEALVNLEYIEICKRVEYLKSYTDKECFEKYIEIEEGKSIDIYTNYVYKCFEALNDFYEMSLKYTDFFNIYGHKIFSFDDILKFYFKSTEDVSLEEFGKKETIEDFFGMFDMRWKKPLPTITKGGVITLPNLLYISDGYYSNYLQFDYRNQSRIDLISQCFNLCFNDINKKTDMFYNWSAMSENNGDRKYDRCLKKKAVQINIMGLDTVTAFANGNIKLKFENKKNAFEFFDYFKLGECKERV